MRRVDHANRTRYWLDQHTAGLSLLAADFTTHEYPSHVHEALLIAVTESGGSEIKAGGGPDEAHSSALLVVNPTEPHSSRMNRSHRWRYRSFYLDETALCDVAHGLGLAEIPYFSHNIFRDADLIADFLALHRTIDLGADQLKQRELLIGTFGRLIQRHGTVRPPERLPHTDLVKLRSVTAEMHDRFSERLKLQDLALRANLTQFQLIGLFRKGVGMTPHAYLMQIRLQAARQMLRERTPISIAATAAGFYDQPALTTHFRRCFGITPLQFVHAGRP